MNRDDAVKTFERAVANLTPLLDEEVVWPLTPQPARLRVRTYPAPAPWPEVLTTSVRAVVFRGRAVMVIRERDGGRHIVPGGGREPGETIEETLRRELGEECGWRVGDLKPLAVHHFRHLGPPPKEGRHPWVDFLQPIFVAEGMTYDRRTIQRAGEIEEGSSLVPISRALSTLSPSQCVLLQAALRVR